MTPRPAHFRLVADFAPVMIWLAGPDRKAAFFNRPWLEFTGRALDAELEHGWTEGVHADDRAKVEAGRSRAFDERSAFEMEYRLRRADGDYRWILDKGVPLFDEGSFAGFVGSCLDITEPARDQFLATVAHELRSPLNGIKTWAHVLENHLRDGDSTVRRAIDGIMAGVDQQVRLIDHFLGPDRIRQGRDLRSGPTTPA